MSLQERIAHPAAQSLASRKASQHPLTPSGPLTIPDFPDPAQGVICRVPIQRPEPPRSEGLTMATDAEIGQRFRLATDYARRNGFAAGFPNFHRAKQSDRIVYGHFLLRDAVVRWRDVPASEFPRQDAGSRLSRSHDYAQQHGYQHGFPTFHSADYGRGAVFGTNLIVHGTCTFRDVPTAELGLGNSNPNAITRDRWFTHIHDYSWRSGFRAGMPSGHYDRKGSTWVIGVFLFPYEKVEWRDIRGKDIGLEDIYPAPPPPTYERPGKTGGKKKPYQPPRPRPEH